MSEYILDACAVLAFLNGEEGVSVVRRLLDQAKNNEITLTMNAVNLIEVYYDRIRVAGTDQADVIIQNIYDTFPISIIDTLDPAIVHETARLKAAGNMSFADAILVATAQCSGATIVSCDHIELEPIERHGHIPFLWIRP